MAKKIVLNAEFKERLEDSKKSKIVEDLSYKVNEIAHKWAQEIIEKRYKDMIEANKILSESNEELYKANRKLFKIWLFLAWLCILQSATYLILHYYFHKSC